GFQDIVQVQGPIGMLLGQAVVTVAAAPAQQARAIDEQYEVAEQPRWIEDAHAAQTPHQLGPQRGEARGRTVAEEMVEGVVDGTRALVGVGQAVEVGQDVRTPSVELEVELAAAAQLTEIEPQSPPGQKAPAVNAGVLVAGVGQLVEPGVE